MSTPGSGSAPIAPRGGEKSRERPFVFSRGRPDVREGRMPGRNRLPDDILISFAANFGPALAAAGRSGRPSR